MLEVNFNPFPLLETQRLVLREVTNEDAAVLFRLRSDPRVMENLSRPTMTSIDEAYLTIQRMLDARISNTGISWIIALKEDPAMIGTISFWRVDKEHHRAETGYILDPVHWRKGIMSEALSAILSYGFGSMKLHSVEANIRVGNTPSACLLQKHGFIQEAHFKENFYCNGVFEDSLIYCLLEKNRLL